MVSSGTQAGVVDVVEAIAGVGINPATLQASVKAAIM
jgi:hypothetical protein